MVSDYLSNNGFNEIMCNSLTKGGYYENREAYKNNIAYIINPLSADLDCMRQTLIFGGLESIIYNINRKNNNLKFYEFGNCYFYNKIENPENNLKQYSEIYQLGIFITGSTEQPNWTTPETKSTFYFLKSYVGNVLAKTGLFLADFEAKPIEHELLENGIIFMAGKQKLVEMGVVKNEILKVFDIKQEVFVAEINWNLVLKLSKNHKIQFKELPKYPEVRRDLSMVLDTNITYGQLTKLVEKTERKLIKSINLFDVYQGDKIEKGKKSYAVSFILQDEEKTLTDNQIDKVMNNLMKAFESELGAIIRQ
jgi:phenylalanyl-tRNA synthetase beta chain